MNRATFAGCWLLSLLCSSCASIPMHYYTLTRTMTVASGATPPSCCKVQIKHVLIPAAVDRPELVMRSGEDQALILSNDSWLAPLRDELRDALRGELDLQLSKSTSRAAAAPRDYVLQLEVTRFESVPGQYAAVSAQWRVQASSNPATSVSCETTARLTIGNGIPAVVRGYQQATAQIADRIAVNVMALDGGRPPRCGGD